MKNLILFLVVISLFADSKFVFAQDANKPVRTACYDAAVKLEREFLVRKINIDVDCSIVLSGEQNKCLGVNTSTKKAQQKVSLSNGTECCCGIEIVNSVISN